MAVSVRPVLQLSSQAQVELIESKVSQRSPFRRLRATLEKELLKEHPRLHEWFDENLDDFCGGKRPILVAMVNGEVAGILIGRITSDTDSKISMVYVLEKYKRHGVATKLLGAFQDLAIGTLNRNKIHLSVYADDEEAIRFFKSHGYTIRDEWCHKTEFPERRRYVLARDWTTPERMLRNLWLDRRREPTPQSQDSE